MSEQSKKIANCRDTILSNVGILNSLGKNPDAILSFNQQVDALVWNDEIPSQSPNNLSSAYLYLASFRTFAIFNENTREMNELFDVLRLACPNWSFFEKDRFNIEQQGVYRLMYEEAAVQMKEAFEQHERRRRKSGEVS